MGQDERKPNDLRGEDNSRGGESGGDSAPAGCTEVGHSDDSPDSGRTGGVDAAGGGGAQAKAEAGRLRGFLQDLVEEQGRVQAADRLGVSERTLRRALASPQLTPHMTHALERELEASEARAASERRTPASLHKQLRRVERRLADLQRKTGGLLEELWEAGDDLEQIRMAVAPRAAGANGRLGDVGLVTIEPAPDDAEVYGAALPVVAEWRRTRRTLEEPPNTVTCLQLEERLLRLEIQLVDDHSLTLPPADDRWDQVRRETEVQLRQQRLRELRRERLWAEPLHWVGRLVTLGRWGRGLSLERQMQHEFEVRRAELLPPGVARWSGRGESTGRSKVA